MVEAIKVLMVATAVMMAVAVALKGAGSAAYGDTVVSCFCRSWARVKSRISWIMESVSAQSSS